jgi:transcriptional regulator with XRE-family HTH domain
MTKAEIPINHREIFSRRLSEQMISRKMNDQRLADIVGTRRQTISSYRNESSQPTASLLHDIAAALDVSSDYLIGLTNSPSNNLDDQAISKRLGLTQEAINFLQIEKFNYSEIINILLTEKRISLFDSLKLYFDKERLNFISGLLPIKSGNTEAVAYSEMINLPLDAAYLVHIQSLLIQYRKELIGNGNDQKAKQ